MTGQHLGAGSMIPFMGRPVSMEDPWQGWAAESTLPPPQGKDHVVSACDSHALRCRNRTNQPKPMGGATSPPGLLMRTAPEEPATGSSGSMSPGREGGDSPRGWEE